MNTTPTRIRNSATDEIRDHAGGLIPDGWGPLISMLLLDGGARPSAATLGAAQRILGDVFDKADYRSMTDQTTRRTVVRKRLGAAAEGKAAMFLDAAWSTLAGTGSTPAAASDPLPRMTDADAQAGRDAAAGAHDTRTRVLGDAWKSPEHLARDREFEEAAAAGGGDARAAYRARCITQAASWRGRDHADQHRQHAAPRRGF